jgi:hypothetical protein
MAFTLTGGVEGETPLRHERVAHGGGVEGSGPYDVYEVPIVWVDGDLAHPFPIGDRTAILLGGGAHLGFGPWGALPVAVPTVSAGLRF